MKCAKTEKKSMDQIPNKKQSLDKHNNEGKIEERSRAPFLKVVMEDTGIGTYRELKIIYKQQQKLVIISHLIDLRIGKKKS